MIDFTWTDKQNNVDDVMAEDINAIAHAVEDIGEQIDGVPDKITKLSQEMGSVSDLSTTEKESVVGAINEVNAKAENIDLSGYATNEEIGSLSDLTTTNKSTVVGAINEVRADINGLENNVVSVDNNLSALTTDVGERANLTTSDTSNLVSAVNEINSKTNSIADNTTVIVHEYGGFAAGRGAVVQQENNSGSPIAIGVSAIAKYNGIAIGAAAKSTGAGVTMGQGAECDGSGFAAGYRAKTGHGIAIGDQAKAVDANGKGIDAVQLGKGTNNIPKTMQVYDKRIVEADGSLTDVGNLSDLNTADKTSIVSAVNEVNSKTDSKSDKVTISASTETASEIEMAHNTEIRYGEMTSLTITLPETLPDDYISSVVFTSGETAVNMVYPETIKMSGEGCIDGVFVPVANKRYTVILSYDGVYVSGIVGGVGI